MVIIVAEDDETEFHVEYKFLEAGLKTGLAEGLEILD